MQIYSYEGLLDLGYMPQEHQEGKSTTNAHPHDLHKKLGKISATYLHDRHVKLSPT